MTHGVHTHNDAQLKRRGFRLAMVFASTALISGSVILPATAATTAVSQPTVASVVTDGGKGGEEQWGGHGGTGGWPGGNSGTIGEAERCGITGRCEDWSSGGRGGTGGQPEHWREEPEPGGRGGTGGASSNGGKPTPVVERFPS
ncbi:hypothetical protein ACFV80_41200 [Streptomyces sp. NPDC059862]|uniref:hypothetical protein n=1 Tax=Streptomyces sp. NPDC059862 TaxID=3346975 RepID=UPI003662F9CC